ncbi:N-acetylmuramoyl-L-alanine amidase [Algoriphagus ratkowskyi]|uniref:Amidase n=1 Tax=Algoriphagus ratkowskyi TaxID=57028 RepID=A0A2W7R3D4_9BACT|nr:N-acetylmuramoyl-L-alanine amidase [Algoriphagus ratkowskyi]PZX54671.1 N-acetylmuramoyl-L-alanine amidase [Algoriphagus ratkowskyi]TXD76983.1 amidase [Algoriphagus ratkowskyi]
MESNYGFVKMTSSEFISWIQSQRIARTIITVQQHHTWSPNYTHFNGRNHFERQIAMKNHHIRNNGWSDIGQHFTSFPDGTIVTGRSLEATPACIYGANRDSICIEHLGNFDVGGDTMTNAHRLAIIQMNAALCDKFRLPVSTFSIIYHHWFELSTGKRNNGTGGNKSCPGTDFFGGNKVDDCMTNFLPFVQQQMQRTAIPSLSDSIEKYIVVTAGSLNIRTDAKGSASKVRNRDAAQLGAILRVYGESNGWYKISSSQSHWVYGKFTLDVQRATVNANVLRVRSGPGTEFSIVDNLMKSEEVFISTLKGEWAKISLEEKWLSKSFLNFR